MTGQEGGRQAAGAWPGVGGQVAGQTTNVERRVPCSHLCFSPDGPPWSSVHLHPAASPRVGWEGRPGPSDVLDGICRLLSIAPFPESPPPRLTGSLLWEGSGMASLCPPTLTWDGGTQDVLMVKSQLPPPPQSWQISAHVIAHNVARTSRKRA